MRPFLPFLLTMVIAASASGAESLFYLGAYNRSHKSNAIYVGRLDAETGKLGPLTLAAEGENMGYLAQSPDGKYLYATTGSAGNAVGAYRADAGKLTPLNAQPSRGGGACHVSVDAEGRHVFVAHYGSGSVAVLPIQPDGSLGAPTGFAQFTGSGPDESRQKAPHAHCIFPDEAGRFVYSCDLGTDNVWIFRLDRETGALTPAAPPVATVTPGAGPRHLAWHPNGKFAYVNGEMALDVTVFSRLEEGGKLVSLQTISSLPPGVPRTGNSSAAIICHPSGKWLYVSNRGHDSLTVFAIGDDGRLTWVENVPAAVKFPRDFKVDPSGRWLIAAGQNDDRIVVFKIDSETGKLTLTDQSAEVGSPLCVLFAR